MKIETYKATKDILLATPLPSKTRTYIPVSNEQLIDLTLNSIVKAGFELDKEIYSSAKEGKVANGRFTISNVADSEMQLQIGWQNSYDKSLSLKFAIGTKIFICSNGCVSGDYGSFRKKHSGDIGTFAPDYITEYIKKAGDSFVQMQKEREQMKEIKLTRKIKSELIGRMFIDAEIIESTQVNIIKKELNKPTHDFKAVDSMWELYQFTTFALKDVHPSLWMKNHIDAHNFFTAESKIISITSKIIIPDVKQLELFEL